MTQIELPPSLFSKACGLIESEEGNGDNAIDYGLIFFGSEEEKKRICSAFYSNLSKMDSQQLVECVVSALYIGYIMCKIEKTDTLLKKLEF